MLSRALPCRRFLQPRSLFEAFWISAASGEKDSSFAHLCSGEHPLPTHHASAAHRQHVWQNLHPNVVKVTGLGYCLLCRLCLLTPNRSGQVRTSYTLTTRKQGLQHCIRLHQGCASFGRACEKKCTGEPKIGPCAFARCCTTSVRALLRREPPSLLSRQHFHSNPRGSPSRLALASHTDYFLPRT